MNDDYTEHCVCYEEDEETPLVVCPSCGVDQLGAFALIGSLGSLNHYRCRHCGWQWAEEAE